MPTSRNPSTSEHPFVSSSHAKSLWRNRDYMLLWSGQALSDMGGAVSGLAFPLLVLAVTHSPTQAGFGAALRTLCPPLLFSLFAGVHGGSLGSQTGDARVRHRARAEPCQHPSSLSLSDT
jgi:hypothetical protein